MTFDEAILGKLRDPSGDLPEGGDGMITVTYEALNDVVLSAREAIAERMGIEVETPQLFRLNDALSRFLGSEYGVLFEDEEATA